MIRISKILSLIFFFVFINYEISFSQLTTIKGAVTDSIANPVENVSVSLLNTTFGTYSSIKGSYSLSVKED